MDLGDFLVTPDLRLAVLHLQDAAVAVRLAVAGAQRRELEGAKLAARLEVELGLDHFWLFLLDHRLNRLVHVELLRAIDRLVAGALAGQVDDLVGLALLEVQLAKVLVGVAVGAADRPVTVSAFAGKVIRVRQLILRHQVPHGTRGPMLSSDAS